MTKLSLICLVIVTSLSASYGDSQLGQWVDGGEIIPNYGTGVVGESGGFNFDDKIYLVGGGGDYGTKLFEFDTLTDSLQVLDEIPNKVNGGHTQINYIIYMITKVDDSYLPDLYISTFDMSTKTFSNNVYQNTVDGAWGAPCLTHIDDKYLVLTGGTIKTNHDSIVKYFRFFDLATIAWAEGPSMINPRNGHACIQGNNNWLYAIAGQHAGEGASLQNVEKIDISDMNNINSKNWQPLTATLSSEIRGHVATKYNHLIYVIGGFWTTNVDVIDTNTDTITSIGTVIAENTWFPGACVVPTYDKIYLFGGANTKKYQFAELATPVTKMDFDYRVIDPCENVECSSNLVCVAGACQRDCNAFKIDDFLLDCSTEFMGNEDDILTLQGAVSTLQGDVSTIQNSINGENGILDRLDSTDADILSITGRLTVNEGDINSLESADTVINGKIDALEGVDTNTASAIATISEQISGITDDITAINARLALYSAQSERSIAHVISNANTELIPTNNKDMLIIFLLVLNILIMIGICIASCLWIKYKTSLKSVEYKTVNQYSSADENQQLKN